LWELKIHPPSWLSSLFLRSDESGFDLFLESIGFSPDVDGDGVVKHAIEDRRTDVKRLRVRGMKAVRFCITLKALGLNILRAAAVRSREDGGKAAATSGIARLIARIGSLIRKTITQGYYVATFLAPNDGDCDPLALHAV
jgi:hypothetical protein